MITAFTSALGNKISPRTYLWEAVGVIKANKAVLMICCIKKCYLLLNKSFQNVLDHFNITLFMTIIQRRDCQGTDVIMVLSIKTLYP